MISIKAVLSSLNICNFLKKMINQNKEKKKNRKGEKRGKQKVRLVLAFAILLLFTN